MSNDFDHFMKEEKKSEIDKNENKNEFLPTPSSLEIPK